MDAFNADLQPGWLEWVARNKSRGVSDEELLVVMMRCGLSTEYSNTLIEQVTANPIYKASVQQRRRNQNLEAMNDVKLCLFSQSEASRAVPRIADISREEFFDKFYAANRPVVLTGQMNEWPAFKNWTPKYFREVWGDLVVEVQSCRKSDPVYEVFLKGHTTQTTMRQFVDRVTNVDSTNEFYLTANDRFLERHGIDALLRDFWPFPRYFEADRHCGKEFLWFGPKGAVSPLHRDRLNVMMTQVYGCKRVRLIPAEALHRVYNFESFFSEVDCEKPDYERFEDFRGVPFVDVELLAGEALLIPVGWWHHVRSLEISINISFTNFVFPNDFESIFGIHT